jgi:hypothetical protein
MHTSFRTTARGNRLQSTHKQSKDIHRKVNRFVAPLISVLATLLLAGAAMAGERLSVEYSANQVIESEAVAIKSTVYVTPTKERREMSQGGTNMVMISRFDKKVIWTLMPEQKMYMEMAMTSSSDKSDLSGYQIEQTPLGEEKLDGQTMNKSKIIMTHSSGSKFGGFMWTTKEGIPAKIDALSVTKGSKDRFKMEQNNIKVGKQPPELFEIPKDFQVMNMGGMGDMFKGRKGR